MIHEISTPRLKLRALKNGDGVAIAQACQETWDDLALWMRWTIGRENPPSIQENEDYALTCNQRFNEGTDFTFGGFSKKGNELILITRLHPRNKGIGYIEFGGYWVRKKYQGHGYMTEAVNAMIAYAFDHLDAKRLEITVADNNYKSIGVIERLGFKQEARLKLAHHLPDNRVADELIYVRFDKKDLPH